MTGSSHPGQPRAGRPLWAAGAALTVLVWTGTTGSLSAWNSGALTNSVNQSAPLSMAFSHNTGGACTLGPRVSASTACAGSLLPTVASAATAVTGSTVMTNDGTAGSAQLSQSVSGASCATVQLTNRVAAANVMLPRYDTDFLVADPWGGTNAAAFTGTSGSYAAAVTSRTLTSTATRGYGIWFKAAADQVGPLFSFDLSATNASNAADDRALYLRADGRLTFEFLTSTGSNQTVTSTAAYDDGAWHFAYAKLVDGATTLTTTLYVDSANASSTVTAAAYAAPSGYWHVAYAPTALTGLTTSGFTGSLSNLVSWSGTNAQANPPTTAQRASQTAFNGWANGTDHWLLGDTGTTTYTGTQPTIGTTSPCTFLNIAWTVANPAATVVSTKLLSAFANGAANAFTGGPAPATGQTGTISITRAATYNAYVSGLRLYVPLTRRVQVTGGQWPLTFQWSTADSVVIA